MDEDHLLQQVCNAAHQLWMRGLIAGADGLVALELHRRRYLVTPPGRRRINLQPADLICVDMQGVDMQRDARLTPEAWEPHRVVFQNTMNALPEDIRRGDAREVKATVLGTPPKLTALLALDPAATALRLHGHAPIPVVWANDEKALTDAILKHPLVALQGTGLLASGPTLGQTLSLLEHAEQAAEIEITLRQLR
ncbi:MAG: class II aldolase/adducin family protein [Planctomycetota bacterium]